MEVRAVDSTTFDAYHVSASKLVYRHVLYSGSAFVETGAVASPRQ